MKNIELTQGKYALVYDEDYKRVSKLKWHAQKHRKRFYAKHTTPRDKDGKQRTIKMHRFILGIEDPNIQVDHINMNGLDNRKQNLRTATPSQQSMNRSSRKGSTSEYIGVSWDSEKCKWKARVGKNGKDNHIGYFEDEKIAAIERDKVAKEMHGQYASLNF